MAFILTKLSPSQGKVHDPDRNIELVSLGGGSDLRRGYRLVSRYDEQEFRGRTAGSSMPSELQAGEGIKNLTSWEIRATDRPFRFGPNPEDTVSLRDLIVEAMTQYGFSANKKPTDLVSVKFISPQGDVEEGRRGWPGQARP